MLCKLPSQKHGSCFLFKREHISLAHRKRVVAELEKRLERHHFFLKLPMIDNRERVRLYTFGKKKFVLKYTEGRDDQGYDYQGLRKKLAIFHARVRSAVREKKSLPLKYHIIMPRVFARINNTLVMEYMGMEMDPRKIVKGPASQTEIVNSYMKAREQLAEHLQKFFPNRFPLQAHQAIPLANTNPANPAKGIWYVALPYDYV